MRQSLAASLISAMGMFFLSLFILHETSSMSPAAAVFPRILSKALSGFSLMLIISAVWTHIRTKKPQIEKAAPPVEASRNRLNILKEAYPFLIIVFCVFFMTFFSSLGFEISAFGVMFATMLLIDRKQAFRKFYYALIIPALLVLLFKLGIGLRLPLFIDRFFE